MHFKSFLSPQSFHPPRQAFTSQPPWLPHSLGTKMIATATTANIHFSVIWGKRAASSLSGQTRTGLHRLGQTPSRWVMGSVGSSPSSREDVSWEQMQWPSGRACQSCSGLHLQEVMQGSQGTAPGSRVYWVPGGHGVQEWAGLELTP